MQGTNRLDSNIENKRNTDEQSRYSDTSKYFKNRKKMHPRSKIRTGFSMKVEGVLLNRPDLHNIAAELGVSAGDVLTKNKVLTVYNTSQACQEIINDNALVTFIAMALEIPPENISNIKEVVEEPVKIEFDLSEFEDDEDEK